MATTGGHEPNVWKSITMAPIGHIEHNTKSVEEIFELVLNNF